MIFQQQPDAQAREELHDYAFAALQLLIEKGCVDLARPPSPPTNKRIATTAAAATSAAETTAAGGGGSPRGAGEGVHGNKTSLPKPPLPASKRQKVVPAQQQGAQTPLVKTGMGTGAPVPSTGQERVFHEVRSAGGGRGGGGGDGDRAAGGGRRGADDWLLMPTKLGMAIFRSSMPPGDGLMVYRDLSGDVAASFVSSVV